MKRNSAKHTDKDQWLRKLLHTRWVYLVLAGLLVVYVRSSSDILNQPAAISWVSSAVSLLLIVTFLYCRYTRHKAFYRSLFTDAVFTPVALISICLFTLLFQSILRIPLNYFIISAAKENAPIKYRAKIDNVITGRSDKVYFEFMGKPCNQYIKIGLHKRDDLMQNYIVVLTVRPSLWNAYYIEELKIVQKD